MANIEISDLTHAGYDLFYDSESYMIDLSGDELEIHGGITPITPLTPPGAIVTAGIVVTGLVFAATQGKNNPQTTPRN